MSLHAKMNMNVKSKSGLFVFLEFVDEAEVFLKENGNEMKTILTTPPSFCIYHPKPSGVFLAWDQLLY
jgi:hypothetical protein|tara:strand:- start:2281 stop:2484 length:204 start_codon:yes stop_codon:yes gene_type:complete